jgi:prepilin-type N-terminal cleavage/methylation domain-containing protein
MTPRYCAVFRPPTLHGFTLIELAIVLFVITLLLGGVLTPLGRQIGERQISDTRRDMEYARTALVGYALGRRDPGGRGHLPCPDLRLNGPGGIANDGLEDRLPDGACAQSNGNLPWLTLGLERGDAWGNRLGYAVAPDWAKPGDVAGGSAAALLRICLDAACVQSMPAAALLISHGPNGYGASNAGGGVNLAPTSPAELENVNGDTRFMMLPPRAADRAGGEFDDLLLPLSADWLRGRLCGAESDC